MNLYRFLDYLKYIKSNPIIMYWIGVLDALIAIAIVYFLLR